MSISEALRAVSSSTVVITLIFLFFRIRLTFKLLQFSNAGMAHELAKTTS